jgi:hypothetical protein
MTRLEIGNRRLYFKKALQYLKNKTGCTTCGYNLRTDKLCFHHKIGSIKLFELSKLPTEVTLWKTIKEEINKCVLLCRRCHQKVHVKTMTGRFNVNF